MNTKTRKEYLQELANVIKTREISPEYAVSTVVFGMLFTLPCSEHFFMAEGKTVDECVKHLNSKLGEKWHIFPNAEEQEQMAEAIFEYYGITEEAMAALDDWGKSK